MKYENGGARKEEILITSDTFKSLCMLINNERGKEVRKYFLSIEKLVKKYHEDIQEQMRKKIGLLETNQKPKVDITGGVIYVIEAQNSDVALYKIGKSGGIKKRLTKYNTENANDIEPLFIIKVNDRHGAEACIKETIKEHKYRKYKEIYEIDLDVLKRVMTKCADFTDGMREFMMSNTKKSEKLEKLKDLNSKLFIKIE